MSYSATIAKRLSTIMNPFPLTLIMLLIVTYASSINLGIFMRWTIIILLVFVVVPHFNSSGKKKPPHL